jgi:hypothetical protein
MAKVNPFAPKKKPEKKSRKTRGASQYIIDKGPKIVSARRIKKI